MLRFITNRDSHILSIRCDRRATPLFSLNPPPSPQYRPQVGDVIAKSDYVVVAAALTPESKGMVGEAELAKVSAHSRLQDYDLPPQFVSTATIQDSIYKG